MPALLTTIALAASLQGQCLLEVELEAGRAGVVLFDGACEIRMAKDGSLDIVSDADADRDPDAKLKYNVFLRVTEPGKATASWKGDWASTKWLNDMGELTRDGACWSGDIAKICAWR